MGAAAEPHLVRQSQVGVGLQRAGRGLADPSHAAHLCSLPRHDAALDRAIRPTGTRVTPIPYDWGSPAIAGLWRVDVSGESAQAPGQDDQASGPLSYTHFVKLLRHPRRWPGLVHLPDQASRDEFVGFFPWRFELDMYECGIGAVLPAGMRTPRLHHVRKTDDDHLGLWWEFVPERPASWDPITGAPWQARLPSCRLRVTAKHALLADHERVTTQPHITVPSGGTMTMSDDRERHPDRRTRERP